MIFYFSATGNCKYTSERIAAKTGDKVTSIQDVNDFEMDLTSEKYVGFVTPTYAWGLPVLVSEFLEKIRFKISDECFVYFISTYGTTPGLSTVDGKRLLKKNGIIVDSVFSIKMPDTWTPLFNLSDSEKVQKKNENADMEIDFVIQDILDGKKHFRVKRQLPLFTEPAAKAWYENMRQTKNLYVEKSCVGCGLCARKCPVQAIEIVEGKPVWKKDKCAMCLGCLHRCPMFAIQYGNGTTKKHGQYKNPNVKI